LKDQRKPVEPKEKSKIVNPSNTGTDTVVTTDRRKKPSTPSIHTQETKVNTKIGTIVNPGNTSQFSPVLQDTETEYRLSGGIRQLPQTGEESSVHLSLLGVATILGLLGTLQISRKREK